MNETQVITIVIAILRARLDAMNLNDVQILQKFQPQQQGVPPGRVIYLHKINNHRYGHPAKRDIYDSDSGDFDTEEEFIRLVTYQVDARAQRNPSDLNALTSCDLVEIAADILQFRSTRESLLSDNIGIERITDVRPNYEVNDKDRFEQTSNFDFTLNYSKTYTSTVQAVESYELQINRV